MKVFYGLLLQETNTFCPTKSDMEIFRRGYVLKGDEIKQRLLETNTEIAGFFTFFRDKDAELVPGIACWAVASGKVKKNAYEEMSDQLCDMLKAALPVEGVFLAMHGAMVSESIDDCEGDILQRVRNIVGEEGPVVVSLDYHANITTKMVNNADIMIGYRTYPHVDFEETGYRAADALYKLINGTKPPKIIYRKLPLIVPVEDAETDKGVSGKVMRWLDELEKQSGIVSTSFFCAQPWLDIEEAGVALLLYVQNEEDKWSKEADDIAKYVMDNKKKYYSRYPSVDEALNLLSNAEKPVIFVDSGDITTAGSIGDSTVILRAMRDTKYKTALSMVSGKAVEQAFSTGIGNYVDICIGGDNDYGYNTDVTVHAKVVSLLDKPSEITGRSFSGIKADSGRRAYIKVGDNLNIVVAEYATLMYDPQFLRDMGIEPTEMEVIMQKSHKLFRAAYKDIAKTIIALDTPGFTDKNLPRLPYKKVPRPIYPLDEI